MVFLYICQTGQTLLMNWFKLLFSVHKHFTHKNETAIYSVVERETIVVNSKIIIIFILASNCCSILHPPI